MNVESKPTTTATITKQTDTVTNPTATSTATADGKSFKDELQTGVKATDATKTQSASMSTKQADKTSQVKTDKTTELKNAAQTEQPQMTLNQQNIAATQNPNQISGQVSQNQLANEKSTKKTDLNSETKDFADPLSALKETINTLKSSADLKVNSVSSKSTFKTEEKSDSEITLKMDDKDVSFFLNLVQSEMTAQIGQATGTAANTNNQITEIKTQATQQPVQVSAALLDALSQSAQSGKSVRIDFDDNIAVIMKLDKNGKISANFIPGDTAVENYLRNNISLLQQNFDDKNIAYNELTYSKQQKEEQEQKNQQKNNKEKKDE